MEWDSLKPRAKQWWQYDAAGWEKALASLGAGLVIAFLVIVLVLLFIKLTEIVVPLILLCLLTALLGLVGHEMLDDFLG